MSNPNIELFRRTAPKTKLELIKMMSDEDILRLSDISVMRMVKECGVAYPSKSHNKTLRISTERRAGNNWNSTVQKVELYKGELYVGFYVQYANTDTNISDNYDYVFKKGLYRGEVRAIDRYGNPQTHYFYYDDKDRARVLRSICLEYIYTKYANKLAS